MNLAEAERRETAWLTCGNAGAADFLEHWRSYVHGIDDIIDGEITDAEGILAVFMEAAFVYSCPFYLEHLGPLRQLVVNCTSAYADVVAWEKSDDAWKRNFADHYRHFGMEIALAVAAICGGYQHMREASRILRVRCWEEHHNEKGEPV
jgi:hypothetical protein